MMVDKATSELLMSGAPVKKLQYRIKQVYGNDMMYPANDIAETIVKIAGKKTLDESMLRAAAILGFEAERVF